MEARYNEGPRDWHNLFAITRFRFIEVLLHIFYYYWGRESRSLYRELCYLGSLYRGSGCIELLALNSWGERAFSLKRNSVHRYTDGNIDTLYINLYHKIRYKPLEFMLTKRNLG